jgi:hypothetical protein
MRPVYYRGFWIPLLIKVNSDHLNNYKHNNLKLINV